MRAVVSFAPTAHSGLTPRLIGSFTCAADSNALLAGRRLPHRNARVLRRELMPMLAVSLVAVRAVRASRALLRAQLVSLVSHPAADSTLSLAFGISAGGLRVVGMAIWATVSRPHLTTCLRGLLLVPSPARNASALFAPAVTVRVDVKIIAFESVPVDAVRLLLVLGDERKAA